ncbi:MAG: hypothetical protein H7A47_11275 [Verrucomicrobiales bacterium]|nr:hypothetical protein [Verrucomicrobiales bacterium]
MKPWLFCGLCVALPSPAAQMTDSFAARPKATNATATFSGDSTSAGLEPGETPGMHGGNRNHTIWAEWAAPANGWVTIDTLGTTFTKPVLAVYVGTQLSSLAPVARGFEDDSGPNPAMVRFPATTGTAYAIVVDGERNTSSGDGPAQVNVKFTAAELPDSVVGTDSFSRRGALVGTHALGVCENRPFVRDSYELRTIGEAKRTGCWSWTAPGDGAVVIDTFGSACDTALAVLRGETLANLVRTAFNEDAAGTTNSEVRFTARRGEVFQIVVDGEHSNEASEGNIVLNVNQARTEPHPDLTVYKATEIEIFARQGAVYQLLVSRDLIHWEEWGEPFVGEDQPVRFFDSSRAHGYRFFQAEIR